MSEQAPTAENMFLGMTDGELLTYKVKMVAEVSRLMGAIATIDSIRAERAPFDLDADIIAIDFTP